MDTYESVAPGYDLIIIGAGPAGMTAGIYAARKQLKTLVLTENVGGQTLLSSAVENYLGYSYISGEELARKFKEHLERFAIEMRFETITTLRRMADKRFEAKTTDDIKFTAPTIIVSSGKSPHMLGVPGEKEFTGRGVTYCSTCDAPLFKDLKVAVIGGGNSGLDATIQLAKIASKIYLIEYGASLQADEIYQERLRSFSSIEILTNTETLEIKGDKLVNAIAVKNHVTQEIRELKVQGIFIEIGLEPNVSFVPNGLELNQTGEIIVDHRCRTNMPGFFAAGDVTNVPHKQIIIAAGEGAKAALSAYDYLLRWQGQR